MRTYVMTGIVVLVSLSLCAQTPKKAAPEKKPVKAENTAAPTAPVKKQDELSADFKKQAWRALDAFNRLPMTLMERDMDSSMKTLINDTSKAIDEAKYAASTDLDRYVLHALQMALISKETQGIYDILDPKWKPAMHRAAQCKLEVTFYITPDQLSEKQIEEAKRLTCNKQTDEWDSGITK